MSGLFARLSGAAALLFLGLGLTACQTTDLVVSQRSLSSQPPATVRSFLRYVAADGTLLYEMPGNPFSAPRAETLQALETGTKGAVPGMVVRFTDDPAETPHPTWRVVFRFAGPAGATPGPACAATAGIQPVPAGSSDLFAEAAFCNRGKLIATVNGSIGDIASPDDPRFPRLIYQMVDELFTNYDPDLLRDGAFMLVI